jgi:Type II restriction endonuclease EcoO109I
VLEVSPRPSTETAKRVEDLLGLDDATDLVAEARRLYEERLTTRFSDIKVRDRIKRTNPFLLRIRGIRTVREWAERQIQGALVASEEEAVGHLLEAIAINCHPGATAPRYPEDFDYEVQADGRVEGYQVKLSWDCMPMSSRKNLSRTIGVLEEQYGREGKDFIGYFAPCYGKAKTTNPPGQRYTSLSSREFWSRVGGGDADFDLKVGEVVALTCGEFRERLEHELVPQLVEKLVSAALPILGDSEGDLDMAKLFRAVNR